MAQAQSAVAVAERDTPSEPAASAPSPRPRRARLRGSAGVSLLAVPAVLALLVFNYLPMAGLVVAFKDFNISDGIFRSPWNGLDNFRYFFSSGETPCC